MDEIDEAKEITEKSCDEEVEVCTRSGCHSISSSSSNKVTPATNKSRNKSKNTRNKIKENPEHLFEDFDFYELKASLSDPNIKIDLEGFVGKIWCIGIDRDNGIKAYRMFTTDECAKNVKVYGEVQKYAYKLSSEKEMTRSLTISLNGIAKDNPSITKSGYNRSVLTSIYQIYNKYNIYAPFRVNTVIYKPSKQHPQRGGVVSINFGGDIDVDVVAKIRELLCGMRWNLDTNTLSRFSVYMNCNFRFEKKSSK